jgi:hypothetical protein
MGLHYLYLTCLLAVNSVFLLFAITLYSLSALTCPLRYVERLTGYGVSSWNGTVFTVCLLISLFLTAVQRLNLFS